MNESNYYLIPGYQILLTMGELKETQDVAAHFLKFYVDQSEPSTWDSTAIPEIAELYSGSRACIRLLEDLMQQEPPEQYREKVSGGGVVITGEQYIGFTGLIQMLGDLKSSIAKVHNVSFEVH